MSMLQKMLDNIGMSQRDLAKAVGVDPSMVSLVAKGHRCSVHLAAEIARALVSRDASLSLDVSMWMLSLGFAPLWLVHATRTQVQRSQEAMGGRR